MNDSTTNWEMKNSPCLWEIIGTNVTATKLKPLLLSSDVFVYADITIAVPDSNEKDGEQIHIISTYGESPITKTNDPYKLAEAIAIATKDAKYKAVQKLWETIGVE